MSNGDRQNSTNGLMTWLAEQFGVIQGAIGELRAQNMGNRQTVIEIYHQLTHRMDRIEDRIANGHKKISWLRHVPWFKISLLLIATLLVITGHLTVAEIKAYMVKRLLD